MSSVLITGGAGYIGQQLVADAINKNLYVIVLDVNENAEMMLTKIYGEDKLSVVNISCLNKELLEEVFKQYQPDYVIHAAAHRHVPLVEKNPKEAISNNIIGTINLFSVCMKYKVKKCLFISTDKADKPESIYGLTKKAGEELIDSYTGLTDTEFMAVRFCNVLGSPGTVVPVFKYQLDNDLPLTVTDKRMERYFISLEKASEFVYRVLLDVGSAGHIYMLDVGEQTNIYNLAVQMRAEAHKEYLPIKEIGILPGERLTEPYTIGQQAHIADDIYLVK